MKHLGKILWLAFFLVLVLFCVIQLILGNSGLIGFAVAMVILLPNLARTAFSLYRDVADQRNWEKFVENEKKTNPPD